MTAGKGRKFTSVSPQAGIAAQRASSPTASSLLRPAVKLTQRDRPDSLSFSSPPAPTLGRVQRLSLPAHRWWRRARQIADHRRKMKLRRRRTDSHAKASTKRQPHNQHIATAQQGLGNNRIPATTQPNITIIGAPQHRRRDLPQRFRPPGETVQAGSESRQCSVRRQRLATPVIWITPLFCAKVVFGKAQSMAATIQLTPSAGIPPFSRLRKA